ncbi:MAG: hypothetical protein IT428_10480 [Planctomycetaceae bacterium]|nr:hypothetical protein [Planctomycetaceae bacterium]
MSELSAGGPAPESTLRLVQELLENRNAYRHNVFALLGVDPDAGYDAFDQACHQLRQQLDAGRPPVVRGRTLTESDLATAERLKANERFYFEERLWAHTVHGLDRAAIHSALQSIEAIEFPAPESLDPFPIVNAAFLVDLVPQDANAGVRPTANPDLEAFESALLPDRADEMGI